MTTANFIASFFVAAILFFTVGGMYVASCRTALLNEDSRIAQTVLSKFHSTEELDRFNAEHDTVIAAEADKVLIAFADAFVDEQQQTRKGLGHPIPKAKFADFI